MLNWTNKKVLSLGIGLTIGFFIVEFLRTDRNWVVPILSGAIATALLYGLKLLSDKRKSR